jgi:hypothetical protein
VGAETAIRSEKHGYFGAVHPQQEVGVLRVVRDAVVSDASNELVHVQYSRDRRSGGWFGAVGSGIYEIGRLEKSPEWIVLVSRVLGDTRHCVGVEHLKEERSESANQH